MISPCSCCFLDSNCNKWLKLNCSALEMFKIEIWSKMFVDIDHDSTSSNGKKQRKINYFNDLCKILNNSEPGEIIEDIA